MGKVAAKSDPSELALALEAAIKMQRESESRRERWESRNRAGMLHFVAGWMESVDPAASKLLVQIAGMIDEVEAAK